MSYKTYTAPDGKQLFESPTGSIYRTTAEVVDNEINVALDAIVGTPPDKLRQAVKDPATAAPELVSAIGTLNEVFAQHALSLDHT